jgi:CubicO group peptidase (beta-lactamase class C family)
MVGIAAIDWAPVASASIAQVHRAKLNDEAQTEVAIKVQHCGVAEQFVEDSHAVLAIIRLIAWLNSDFEGMLMVWRAYSTTMIKELDFRYEARNLRTVGANMRKAKLEVIVPQPMSFRGRLLVSKRCFAMRFAEGFKITDHVCLSEHGVDKSALMRRVVQAYSQQLFRDGFFNADPHAGNIHVQVDVYRGRCTPVLLDFGMVVKLNRQQRLGYAQLINAVASMDVSGVHKALAEVGYRNSQSEKHPERDLEFFNFIARDTGSRASQRSDSQKFFRDRRAQKEADISAGERDTKGQRGTRTIEKFPESLIFLFRVIGLLRGLCTSLDVRIPFLQLMVGYARAALVEAWVEEAQANCWSPSTRFPPTMLMPAQLRPRPSSGNQAQRNKASRPSLSASASPRRAASTPSQVITVSRNGRSTGAATAPPTRARGGRVSASGQPLHTRGNSANLRVQLDSDSSPSNSPSTTPRNSGKSDLAEFRSADLPPPISVLDAKVSEMLRGVCRAGLAVGIQVAVVRKGELLVDSCAGVLGATDPRPVVHSSLFPLLDLSQLLPSLAVHMLVEDGRLAYEDTVSSFWPAFAQGGKETITVADVLSHSTIVPIDAIGAMPSAVLPQDLADWDAVVAAIAAARVGAPAPDSEAEAEATATAAAAADPEGEPAREQERERSRNEPMHQCRYHSLTNGFILAVLVAKVVKTSWASFAMKHILEPMQLQQELQLSLLGMQPPARSRPHIQSDRATNTIHDVSEPSLSCFTPLSSAASKSGGDGADGSTVVMPTGPSTPPAASGPSSMGASAAAGASSSSAGGFEDAPSPPPLAVASTSNAFAAEIQAFATGGGGGSGGSGSSTSTVPRGGGGIGIGIGVADAPMVRAAAHMGRSSFVAKDRYAPTAAAPATAAAAAAAAAAGPLSGRIGGAEKPLAVSDGAAATATSAKTATGDAAASMSTGSANNTAAATGATASSGGASSQSEQPVGDMQGLQGALGWALRDPGMVNREEVRTAIVPSLNTFSSARALAVLVAAAYCRGEEEGEEKAAEHMTAGTRGSGGSLAGRMPLGAVHLERIRTVRAIDHGNELYGSMRWGMGLQLFDFSTGRAPSGNLPGVATALRTQPPQGQVSQTQSRRAPKPPSKPGPQDRQELQQRRKEERRRRQEEQHQAKLRRVLGHQVRKNAGAVGREQSCNCEMC